MAVPVQIDHVEVGLGRLPSMWEDKPVATGLLRSILEQANSVEGAFFEILTERGIYECVGYQLDVIGALFNVLRNNRVDDVYRAAILGKIAAYFSDGTTEKVLEAFRITTQTDDVLMFEHPYGDVHMHVGAGDYINLYTQTKEVVVAGTNLRISVDDAFDSLVLTELTYTQQDLQVDGGGGYEDLQVDEDGDGLNLADLQVNIGGSDDPHGNSYFAEMYDEVLNEQDYPSQPMAELLFTDIIQSFAYVVDGDGNRIVDQDGNYIIVDQYSFA